MVELNESTGDEGGVVEEEVLVVSCFEKYVNRGSRESMQTKPAR